MWKISPKKCMRGCTSARTESLRRFTEQSRSRAERPDFALSQTVAEELRVPLGSVRMVMGDTALSPFDAGTFEAERHLP